MLIQILLHIGFMFAILILVNIPAPFLGLKFETGDTPKLWYAPPGFVIPIVWFVLFTLLGIALYKVRELHSGSALYIILLGVLCASYAYYTLGLAKLTGISALWFGLWGNIVVILFALYVSWKINAISALSGALVFPVVIWTTFATLIVLGEMRLERLI